MCSWRNGSSGFCGLLSCAALESARPCCRPSIQSLHPLQAVSCSQNPAFHRQSAAAMQSSRPSCSPLEQQGPSASASTGQAFLAGRYDIRSWQSVSLLGTVGRGGGGGGTGRQCQFPGSPLKEAGLAEVVLRSLLGQKTCPRGTAQVSACQLTVHAELASLGVAAGPRIQAEAFTAARFDKCCAEVLAKLK